MGIAVQHGAAPLRRKFPMSRLSSHALFQRIDARMRETGHVRPTRRGAGRPRSVRRVAFEDRVLQFLRNS